MLATIPIRSRGDCVPLEPVPAPATLPSARWYVAATSPRMEVMAAWQLGRAGVTTFLPLRELGPEAPKPCEPLWPGYLFTAAAHLPAGVTAARGIVRTTDGPIATPIGMVERLMAAADKDGIVEGYRAPPRLATGDTVRILNGPFAGAFGTIARVNGANAMVELNLFARTTGVFVKVEQVERVA
jgi:KOW motif